MTLNEAMRENKRIRWINGEVKKFRLNELKVPYMGWNNINIINESKFTHNLDSNSKFYFVHSYYASLNNLDDIVSKSKYGLDFTSAIIIRIFMEFSFILEKS